MCLAQGPQRSDAVEARTRRPSVSSQALYHWATALPPPPKKKDANIFLPIIYSIYVVDTQKNRIIVLGA